MSTRYVAVGDADVAYRVVGEGLLDLLFFYGLGSHVDMHSDDPRDGQFLDALASFSRLIFFDRRGTGASDGLARNVLPAWEEWTEDVRAVLDAAGSDRTAYSCRARRGADRYDVRRLCSLNVCECADLGEYVAVLILEASDYPIGVSQARVDAVVEMVGSTGDGGAPQRH